MRGVTTAITYPGAGPAPVLRVQLRVGENSLVLAFLGRDDLQAIEIGTQLRAKGALVDRRGTPTIYNPEISIIADTEVEEDV